MESRLLAIKTYARSKAASEFYKKWCGILQNFTNILKENHKKLLQEQRLLEKMPEIYSYQSKLNQALTEAHKKEAEYNSIDHKQLSALEGEISQQR
jgi:hypothetical protein